MSNLHKTVLRQLQKAGLDKIIDPEDEKWSSFLKNISTGFYDSDEQINRINNTLDVSLKKSFLLTKKVEENAKNDLRILIEGLPGLISWFDQDLNYLGVNEQFLTFNNKSQDEFIGKKLGSINKNENSKLIIDFMEFAKSESLRSQNDYSININDKEFYIYSHFQKIDNGKIIIIASIDLTERIQLQNIIIKQNELNVKNSKLASLGELAAGIAHEINNPLTVIVNASKQLMNRIDSKEYIINLDHNEIKIKLDKIYRMSTSGKYH